MKKLLIIDGNSIINRAFYAIKQLSTKEGLNTNGIYGFLNIFLKTMDEEAPDYCVVAFDVRAKTFRHKEYEQYKAQRKGMPDELAEQMPVLKELLDAMNIAHIELEGFEADDLIGTVAAFCEKQSILCRILSGDRDDLQLISDKTNVLLTTSAMGRTETVLYDAAKVYEKYGVEPKMLIEVKGLMGDSSDNIPGVAGVGEKTALTLIKKYKSIDGVYENLSEITGALYKKLEAGRDAAYLSRYLGTIKCDVPLHLNLEDFVLKPYTEKLAPLLLKLEFKSFLSRLNIKSAAQVVNSEIKDGEPLTKTDGKFYFAIQDDSAVYIQEDEVFRAPVENLKEVFENKKIGKIANNAKDCIIALERYGITLSSLAFDTAIAAYILDPARSDFSVKSIAEEYIDTIPENGGEVSVLPALEKALSEKLTELGQDRLYFDIELPLIDVLAKMQIAGFKADRNMLFEFSEKLKASISELEKTIYEQAGEEFNINSPKQLGTILFEKLKLPFAKKTKTGYSTNADILEKLKTKHPIIAGILEYRHLSKLKSTYADGLLMVINEKTGKIHSNFNQTVTTTGRISSTEPNLQNIPVRTKLGREFRRVFVASSDEYTLLDADYSQIELRVLSAVADDKAMQEAFKSGVDIHTKTASEVFGVAEFMVTDEMRRRAKAVNFGIVYGIGAFSLAQDISVPVKEAKAYIEKYLDYFSGVRDYMHKVVEDAKENGYVTTLSGRRRYIPELSSSNHMVRAFGERVALNAPIQGTAADIIKLAMIKVSTALKKNAPRSRLLLQVHDELIVEAHKDEADIAEKILRTEMENAYPLSVPLEVEIGRGRSWYDAKK